MSYLQIYIDFRKKMTIIAQIGCIVLCLYFIYQYQDYSVHWGLWEAILPTKWTAAIDNQLDRIGTLILIMPIGIIIASWLNPEIRALQILASFIGVLGMLYGFIFGLKNGTFREYTDMRIFTDAEGYNSVD